MCKGVIYNFLFEAKVQIFMNELNDFSLLLKQIYKSRPDFYLFIFNFKKGCFTNDIQFPTKEMLLLFGFLILK